MDSHLRDANISFNPDGHKYSIKDYTGKITSVTTLIKKYFPVFDADTIIDKMMSSQNWEKSKYTSMNKQQIKDLWSQEGQNARDAGTKMHHCIENYFNHAELDISKEFDLFINFWRDFQEENPGWIPYKTEWIIYSDDGIAGAIDFVIANENNPEEVVLIDWKRSKEIKMKNSFEKGLKCFNKLDHCNYNHYSLQLNLYKWILEKYYNKSVKGMLLVVLHPKQEDYNVIWVDDMKEYIDELVKEIKN